jgi:flagellar hook-associated protein 3 FlgL
MRVAHSSLFDTFISNMNLSLAKLKDLNLQASTQKRVNNPSDDPVGMARILDFRDSLSQVNQFSRNVGQARSWLSLADETLLSVNNLITRAKELAEQASTGTYSADNREQISYEARQILQQMINLSNTKIGDQHIFAGHRTRESPYEQKLWVTSNDAAYDSDVNVVGSTNKTILVQFVSDTAAGVNPGDAQNIGVDAIRYRYSNDGGNTWTYDTIAAVPGDKTLNLGGGVQLTIDDGTQVTANDENDIHNQDGTWLWVYPTAQYLGDDNDRIEVDTFGPSTLVPSAGGTFTRDVMVRIDSATSLDGGNSWVTSNVKQATPTIASSASLVVPGGFLTLSSNAGNALASGNQFAIRPRTMGLDVEISPDQFVQINSEGKEIFGGIYKDPSSNAVGLVDGVNLETLSYDTTTNGEHPQRNLFDSLGRLVAFLETNNQSGVQQSLEDLRESSINVLNRLGEIAGRENRLDVTETVLGNVEYNEQERLSRIEDVDVSELMTKMSQQQMAYQAVLQSSSMIMRMSLVNFM